MSEDGIHGTNGSRGPTEAETRAIAAAFTELGRQSLDETFQPMTCAWSKYIKDGGHVRIGGEVDLAAVVRAVIRSLKPATDEMKKVGEINLPAYRSVDDAQCAADVFESMIDAASPEIKL